MYRKPATPLPIGGVVDDAIRLYRAAFHRAWVPALVMQLVVTGTLIFIRLQNPELVSAGGMLDWEKSDPLFMALYLVAVLGSLIFSNAVTAQLLATRDGQELSIGGSVGTGLRYFLPTLGIAFAFGGVALIGSSLAEASVAALPPLVRAVLVALYVLLALYLMGRLYLATVALMGERTSVLGALRASWRVTHQHWWRAGITIVVVLSLFAMALIVLSLCASVLNLVVRTDTFAGLLAVQLVAAVIQAATVPFFNAGFVATYYDLKLRG